MNICEQLESIRPVGKVTCGLFYGSNILARKERLKRCGFYALQDEYWDKVSIEEAQSIIVDSMCFHIEDHSPIISIDVAGPVAKGFFSSLPDNALFYANCVSGYECISHSYLDVAIVVEINNGVIGLICIEDDQQS